MECDREVRTAMVCDRGLDLKHVAMRKPWWRIA
jgi:hypothetical protein